MNTGVGISFSQSQSIRNECNLLYVCCWYFVCFIRSAKENVCNLQRNITIYTLVCLCYDMKAIHLYCFVPPNLVVCVSNQKLARASAQPWYLLQMGSDWVQYIYVEQLKRYVEPYKL